MISIRNTQRTVPINPTMIQQWAAQTLKLVGFNAYALTIWITTDTTIRRYNARYRNKDKATDILSFPFYSLKPGQHPFVTDDEERILGDIIISATQVVKDAKTFHITLEERLKILTVHGICHLIGYDHETDEQYQCMHQKELELLKRLK